MFKITNVPINSTKMVQNLNHPQAGACVVFEGWVRNHNEGLVVESLEYEIYPEMAVREAELILEEARKKFAIIDIACVHREGHLRIGDIAVWLGATAAHRGEAFKACQYAIDEIKTRLPIWKKEYYAAQEARWVNCLECYQRSQLHFCEKDYYSKQSRIPVIGAEGQIKLRNSRVLVVGAGGLGCPTLSYLAGAGVGHITVYDGDILETSNLHRQTLYTASEIGNPKADLARKHLEELNPFITITASAERIGIDNVDAIVTDYDVVVDCSDNFMTKFLLHDACFLHAIPLVQASVYQFEGQLHVYTPGSSDGCMRCLWPEIPDPGCVGNCTEVGILGVVPGFFGVLQAWETLKILLNLNPLPRENYGLFIDLLSMDQSKIRQAKRSNCPLCSSHARIHNISAQNYFSKKPLLPYEVEVTSKQHTCFDDYILIDIREAEERSHLELQNHRFMHIPGSQFLPTDLARDKNYLLVCRSGIRSKQLARLLQEDGFINVFSLVGGFVALEEHGGLHH